MITKTQETIALVEHIIAFFCDLCTIFFTNNTNIQMLCVFDISQHIIKVARIIIYGFALINSPPWFCYLHYFVNCFSHNITHITACILIFNLYAAIKHPDSFSKYHLIFRSHIYIFVILYTAIFSLTALYEPLILKYSVKHINESHNCSSGYRYKLLQYILTSPIIDLPFTLPAIYCTLSIIRAIRVIPRDTLKSQISTIINISFSRWLRILFATIAITVPSFLNIYWDINNGIKAEKNIEKEEEKLGLVYYITSSSGILIFFLANSSSEIKKKLGLMKEWTTTDYYNARDSFNPHLYYPNRNSNINNDIRYNYKNNNSYMNNNSYVNNNSFNTSFNTSFNSNNNSSNVLLNSDLGHNKIENVMHYHNINYSK
ncbi:hypothetical protein BCR32DRAFT_292634 [Anaeromyces robustus]|uniref:G-protein coupled receptors family 1 profile domain-containing protein n=1 Tax=Anaeromyces robustus TaxID=1754192 RepID=A0A1Y1X9Q8_9FUNG|nr:hypothetical protein BCR32DRAFT_292634 [Anaeromyces robustus]|eukprot:ORX82477.1 hypothetical protein BCR32DRAFT_292634 [Anaeromyces robustus]